MRKKDIPESIKGSINNDIDEMNTFSGSAADTLKLFRKKQTGILKTPENELKLTPENHYRKKWLALGMAAFGVAIGMSSGNLAFLALGLPIGLAIGTAVGTSMDKKRKAAGKQLDAEVKY